MGPELCPGNMRSKCQSIDPTRKSHCHKAHSSKGDTTKKGDDKWFFSASVVHLLWVCLRFSPGHGKTAVISLHFLFRARSVANAINFISQKTKPGLV